MSEQQPLPQFTRKQRRAFAAAYRRQVFRQRMKLEGAWGKGKLARRVERFYLSHFPAWRRRAAEAWAESERARLAAEAQAAEAAQVPAAEEPSGEARPEAAAT